MNTIRREHLLVSTVARQAGKLAAEYGLGVEIAEYCCAWNMDQEYDTVHPQVQQAIRDIPNRLFHGPYNELFPCAIDPRARQLAAERYRQAIALAKQYGAPKIVLHSGYAPNFYYDCWFEEQSILFWKAFLETLPEGIVICLENVLETRPEPLLHVIQEVEDPRLRICLDVGHAHTYSRVPVQEWLELFAPYIAHIHLHGNDRTADQHGHLAEGSLDMAEFLRCALRLCPEATFTLEIPEPEKDIMWLEETGLLQEEGKACLRI